jgi:hypothetical protein
MKKYIAAYRINFIENSFTARHDYAKLSAPMRCRAIRDPAANGVQQFAARSHFETYHGWRGANIFMASIFILFFLNFTAVHPFSATRPLMLSVERTSATTMVLPR